MAMTLEDKAVQLYKAGKTDAEISSRLGIEERIIHRWVSPAAAPGSFFGRGTKDRAQLHRAQAADRGAFDVKASKSGISVKICPTCGREVVAKNGVIQAHANLKVGGYCTETRGRKIPSDRAQLHRALDAVMDRAEGRRAGKAAREYDDPVIKQLKAKIRALNDDGFDYDSPRIVALKERIRKIQESAKVTKV